jgi:hypothetical protein
LPACLPARETKKAPQNETLSINQLSFERWTKDYFVTLPSFEVFVASTATPSGRSLVGQLKPHDAGSGMFFAQLPVGQFGSFGNEFPEAPFTVVSVVLSATWA